jgi:ankyrin repeat protein
MWFRYLLFATIAFAADTRLADTKLIDAVKRHDTSAVRIVVEQKGEVNPKGPDGSTALHWAAYPDDVAN